MWFYSVNANKDVVSLCCWQGAVLIHVRFLKTPRWLLVALKLGHLACVSQVLLLLGVCSDLA